jgi:hypothetical protein
LVQKKTYTPDFLSHEKKYNRGQEEFIIMKDHHDPIISRELFDEANRILDEKSLSQTGKAKHSNRYPFSGKIKCGCCGSGYVARYKDRKDGSRSKAWRCYKAVKYGRPHTDKAGNCVGCSGAPIRNEDAVHILYLVTQSLKLEQEKIGERLLSVIQSVLATDTFGTDAGKIRIQIQSAESRRAKLLDVYVSGDISKEEFSEARAKCDAEIEGLQSAMERVDKQREMILQQQELFREIHKTVYELIGGVEYDDEFYRQILDKMVVVDREHIYVYLHSFPIRWRYAVSQASKSHAYPSGNISDASLPTSVRIPTTCL